MIAASLIGDSAALDRLRALRETAAAGVARAVAQLGLQLQNGIQQNKLSGQVLRARSGALRDSITAQFDRDDMSVSATVSSALDYAAAQEYGFTGTVSIRASLRQIQEAFGRPIAAKTVNVSGYSRRMDLPERSFLRSALDEMSPDIAAAVADALREALN